MTQTLLLWNTALAGSGAALGAFFAVALYLKRREQAANWYLSLFCVCFAVLMVGDVMLALAGSARFPWAGNALDSVFLLLPPLFYLYVYRMVTGLRPIPRILWVCFLPAGACLLWFIAQVFKWSGVSDASAAAPIEFMPDLYTLAFAVIAMGQMIAYCCAAFRLVREHRNRIEEHLSFTQQVDLGWIQAMIGGGAVASLFWIAGIVVHHPAWAALNAMFPPAMMLVLGLLAQRQVQVPALEATQSLSIATQPPGSTSNIQATSEAVKYAKSALTSERMDAIAAQLVQFMAEDKAYLEGDLTLGELSSRIAVPQHQLSQVFNQHLGCSFFEYINRLRVEEAKRCLADPAYASQSVLDIALAAGFNSKAAFNIAFKRFTGSTPSAFRNK